MVAPVASGMVSHVTIPDRSQWVDHGKPNNHRRRKSVLTMCPGAAHSSCQPATAQWTWTWIWPSLT
jgi:hypothetical protein